jgi:CRISPR-associated protein Cas5t
MLLSLVGERFRQRHCGVRLAFAFKRRPKIATTLRKLSRFKYGVPSKQTELGNAPDYIETLCGIEFLCWVDSSGEIMKGEGAMNFDLFNLESRLIEAVEHPQHVKQRYGVVYLGLSDDAVNDVRLCEEIDGQWLRLQPSDSGDLELPVWVDHLGALKTRWRRFTLDKEPMPLDEFPISDSFSEISNAK